MDIVVLVARILLALVFGLAGFGKLANVKATRATILNFSIPSWIATPASLVLPIAEIMLALVLLPNSSAWWGGLFTLGFLALFTSIILFNMARGKEPECGCFGPLHNTTAGWRTVRRNTMLAGIALLVVLAG